MQFFCSECLKQRNSTWSWGGFGLNFLALSVTGRCTVLHNLLVTFTPGLGPEKQLSENIMEKRNEQQTITDSFQVGAEWKETSVHLPGTLLAYFTCLVWMAVSPRLALTYGVLGVSARPNYFLIWDSSIKQALLSQSLCSEHTERLRHWFFLQQTC